MEIKSLAKNIGVAMVKNEHGLFGLGALKSALSQ